MSRRQQKTQNIKAVTYLPQLESGHWSVVRCGQKLFIINQVSSPAAARSRGYHVLFTFRKYLVITLYAHQARILKYGITKCNKKACNVQIDNRV